MVLIDDAVLVAPAAVGQIFPYAPFEETFAAFTTDSPIVTAWKDRVHEAVLPRKEVTRHGPYF